MLIIALGANLPSPEFGSPVETLEAAITSMQDAGLTIAARSPWYESEPVPPSDQPNFINGVVAVETDQAPDQLLATLHGIEMAFGRVRQERNEARVLDLDLIDHDGLVRDDDQITLPHPRMHLRTFVLCPLADIAPGWTHPVLQLSVDELLENLGPEARPVRL